MSKLRIGSFADFNSRDTLLMEGDWKALEELREMFRSLAGKRIRRLAVHRLPFVEIHHGLELTAAFADQDRIDRRSGVGNSFLWERPGAGWKDAADKLEVLAQSSLACHHNFEGEQGNFIVVVSKGEYGDGWWGEHG